MDRKQNLGTTELFERGVLEVNIYEKLSAITMEIATVAKNLEVGEGKGKYKAVGEADVLRAVKPIEAKHRIYSYPASRRVVYENTLTKKSEYQGQVKESLSMFVRIETVYRFVDMDKPEDYIEVTTYGDGVDPQDKATGKAMTYADKYALLKAYKIQTGDDPDQFKSEEFSTQEKLRCSVCGKEIDEKVFNYSLNRYMRPLCRDCQKEVG